MYHTLDQPYYHKGNHQLLYITCGNTVTCLLTKVYFIVRKRLRGREVGGDGPRGEGLLPRDYDRPGEQAAQLQDQLLSEGEGGMHQ